MKFYERSLQALLSSAPRGFAAHSRVLARLASLAQIGELARRLVNRFGKYRSFLLSYFYSKAMLCEIVCTKAIQSPEMEMEAEVEKKLRRE